MKIKSGIYLTIATLVLAIAGPAFNAGAQGNQPAVNPTGAWKVTTVSTNAQARPAAQTLKLKLDGGTLTGTFSYNSSATVNGKTSVSELLITEAKLQGSDISFNFTHPPASGKGPNATYTYQGKISGDTIKGTFAMTWMGQTRTRDWEAKRVKE